MRKPLVAGNWKMNGNNQSISQLLSELNVKCAPEASAAVEMAVFPPAPYLAETAAALSDTGIVWGAQNMCQSAEDGAFTGEISISMLKDFACDYVILGHSERRHIYKESNELVAEKFKISLNQGVKPILCVGETLEEREAGKTLDIVKKQLAAALALHDNHATLTDAVIAYEPVWAIGTGVVATPEQAQEVHAALRVELNAHFAGSDVPDGASQMRLLYGGSVKPSNAASLFAMDDIDGALVGGASLDAEAFLEICKQCNN